MAKPSSGSFSLQPNQKALFVKTMLAERTIFFCALHDPVVGLLVCNFVSHTKLVLKLFYLLLENKIFFLNFESHLTQFDDLLS